MRSKFGNLDWENQLPLRYYYRWVVIQFYKVAQYASISRVTAQPKLIWINFNNFLTGLMIKVKEIDNYGSWGVGRVKWDNLNDDS